MVGILGANSVSGGYEIDNSLRFNDGDSSKLTFTPDGAGDRDTFTFSFWIKRTTLGASQRIFSAGTSIGTNNNNVSSLLFESNDTLKFFGEVGGSASFTLQTNRLFRDPSAWYHIVLAVHTEDGTAANRIKLYVNGVQESSFSTATYMSQNTDTFFNAANLHNISYAGGGGFVDGYLAEFHHIDGTQLAPTDFGEFDDNGVWIPKAYTGAYGTNGFYLEFKETGTSQNSSGIGADTSGNDNHWAVTNLAATDVTTDTPTNNFATLNSIVPTAALFSEGNCFVTGGGSDQHDRVYSSLAVSTGKWYWEVKQIDGGFQVGIAPQPTDANTNGVNYIGYGANEVGYYGGNGNKYINNSASSYGDAIADNDILGVALDLDNNKLYFSKNGTFQNSGDPTSGATGTGAISVVAVESNGTGGYVAAGSHNAGGSYNGTAAYNFGNPSFAISSGNADANGYGNFEYAVPSGYYSLCTKNLGEFG
mgnify:CR=1 FL=1